MNTKKIEYATSLAQRADNENHSHFRIRVELDPKRTGRCLIKKSTGEVEIIDRRDIPIYLDAYRIYREAFLDGLMDKAFSITFCEIDRGQVLSKPKKNKAALNFKQKKRGFGKSTTSKRDGGVK